MNPQRAKSQVAAAGLAVCGLVFGLGACTGKVEGDPNGSASGGGSAAAAGGGGPAAQPNVDPGRVGIHRLNNTEYNNTVRDLLGTTSQPASTFLAEDGLHFDNNASSLGMTAGQYDAYFKAAGDLLTEALASETGRARFLSCVPSAAGDACARQIIQTFGKQVYRRPLDAAEVERAMKVYDADFARAQNGTEAIGQVLRALLSSANFLYRIEFDAAPSSTTPHSLSGYELASRLSYLHWSSMPDAALFAAADSGELLQPAALEASVDRLLADAKASSFVESFAGQWLDVRKIYTHSALGQIFPSFTTSLADSIMAESYLWFQDFLEQDRPLSQWFTADFNYVNDELAAHYGFPAPGTGQSLVRVEVTSDQRQGFLGLASFLTHTSVPSRTSPTTRGAWVLAELLCEPPPPPPPDVPKLDASADPTKTEAVGAENVRERLERHRSELACANCHKLFDPMGLGLERYDGIGRYREAYPNGDPILAEGIMPDGTPYAGPQELGALIGQDPRFSACAASQLLTYALGRELDPTDALPLEQMHAKWEARGGTLKGLLKEVVLTDAFRFRRGEPE